MHRLPSLALLLLLAIPSTTHAGKIRIEGSDQLRTTQTAIGNVVEFIGNVHFVKDSSDLRSDYAVLYEAQEYVRLIGNVRIEQPGRILGADSLYYDQRTEIARAWGRVVVEDRRRHVRVAGGKAIFQDREQAMLITDQPQLVVDFDQPRVPTEVTADTIRMFSREERVDATGAVKILQGSLKATADTASMSIDGEEITLTGRVHASQRASELSGRRMIIQSREKNLEKIEVYEKGEAIFRQPAAADLDTIVYNQSRLTADRIDFFFADDLLHVIKAQGNSFTYYTPAPEDTTARGSNVASGDSTMLLFINGQLSEVSVVTSAEGDYMTDAARDSLGKVTAVDTIAYKADRIKFKIADNIIKLYTAAEVTQKRMNLQADRIDYHLNSKIVYAYAEDDTAAHKYVPLTLRDGPEAITGDQLVFDLNTRRGKIKESRTKLEQAYYSSQELRKEEEGEFLVKDGWYTTCDDSNPHFHFASKSMKLKTDDKVFARPVVLYVETLPVLALPYFVFSIKKDRHSGFLPFQIGNFERGSRFVNNIGYYWAMSDYWDLKTSVDVSDFGLKFNAGARYAVRYKLSGAISGSYTRETEFSGTNRARRTRGQLTFSHNQTLDPTVKISGSGTFVSDSRYFTDYSTDLSNRLQRQITSNMSISKSWERASLSAAVDQTRDLDRNSHSERLPTVSFSLPQRQLFGSPKETADKRWYHDIYFAYDNRLQNSRSKFEVNGLASRKKYAVFDQGVRLNAPLKAAGVLTLSPSISFRDDWYYLPYSDQADSADLQTNSLHSRQSWSSSVSLQTNLYGTVAPNVFGIVGLRHVITPNVSFNYQPAITRNQEYARFTGYGGGGSRSRSLSLSVSNTFQMKYMKGDKEMKVGLLNYDISANYNLEATTRKWSNVTSSLRSPSIRNLTMQVTMTHDLYNPSTGDLRWWSPYLRTISISTGYAGAFMFPIGRGEANAANPLDPEAAAGKSRVQYSISERYSENRFIDGRTSISHWIDFAVSFSPSKNWRLQYRQNYNVRGKESTERVVELYRDLHCWEGSFTWIPDGSRQGYYFKINVKLLPDIKFEKSESGIRDALFGGIGAFQQ